MSQPDTQDQGQGGVELPAALRPRSGWEKAAHNPEAVHNPFIDAAAVPSSGYMSPEYVPPRQSEDAAAMDQTAFTVTQQGHLLGRTGERANSPGAVGPGGRPVWDSRHHVASKMDRDPAPPAQILRPPASNAFPGQLYGTGGLSGGASGIAGAGANTGMDGGSAGAGGGAEGGGGEAGMELGKGRTTQLPGLNAISPASLRPSPYASTNGAAGAAGAAPGSPARGSGTASPVPAAAAGAVGGGGGASNRPSRPELADTYVGRAYSPDGSSKRVGGAGGDHSGAAGSASGGGEAGVYGHGTHLPALDKAYLHHQGKKPPFDLGFGTGGLGATKGRRSLAAGNGGSNTARAAGKEDSLSWLAPSPRAIYMPANGTQRRGASQPRSARAARERQLVPVPPPLPLTSRSHYSGSGSGGGGARVGGQSADGGMPTRRRDDTMRTSGGVWRPSGRQPIPDTLPSPGRSTYRAKADTEGSHETQEEADRRRAQPRTFSPDRYPIVGQGWSFKPEKVAVNPAYKDVRPKYLEAKPPPEPDNATTHLPDIGTHGKPWLTPGKHLLTDSSTPAPKVTSSGRPSHLPAASSPSGVGASPGSTLKRTGGGGKAWGGGTGGKAGKPRRRPLVKQESYSGSDNDDDDGPVDGDPEVLAVIGGVRLMSMVRRGEMAEEIHRQAQENAEMEAEDQERDEAERKNTGGGSADSGKPAADADTAATDASGSGARAESFKTQESSEPQREQRWASEPEPPQDGEEAETKLEAMAAAPPPPTAPAKEKEEDVPLPSIGGARRQASVASAVAKSESVVSAGSAAGARSRVSREGDEQDVEAAPDIGGGVAEEAEEAPAGGLEEGGDGGDADEDVGGMELPDDGAGEGQEAEEAEDYVELPDGAEKD
ncbi:hypothetical protein HYH02_006690 [Chlamydomonas schloesseri]|uniref:Uncharacterized protein n=1 Tax=Chlamydomonas schloesseri TaxID=2026947 RepID=A0A835SWC5_9CHLO|nr:hypothetical protein HYH02_006690 [Chlamydomonas schloesseri]|eukprot:KAG2432707.1 hypothetical protein HYH02_006690 [Chlamydomonas schloesseri]